MAQKPDEDLIEFLRAQIDPANISITFDPGPANDPDSEGDVWYPDYDGGIDYPLVAPVSNDPVVPGGGETGFTGMQSDGGPIQDTIETLQVDCWGGPEDSAIYEGVNSHPDDVAGELASEVWSVCLEAAADASPSGYEWIGADPPQMADDVSTFEMTHYKDIVIVRMKRTKVP